VIPRNEKHPAGVARGFTLLEVLIVIAIISILVVIAVPSIFKARQQAYLAHSRARMSALEDGLTAFHAFDGRNFFPGQDSRGLNALKSMTGSELLARAMWTPREEDYLDSDTPEGYPSGVYTGHSEEYDMEYEGATPLPSDQFGSDPMPILYYPARPGTVGRNADAQYKYNDNKSITTDADQSDFYDFITFQDSQPYAPGEFLLIGAGMDRRYFTQDDLTNFER
jgi:prepilin-type N-terminal cleavage/methylation domain-containing protein